MGRKRVYANAAERQYEYRERKHQVEYHQERLFGLLMDARARGVKLVIDAGALFPQGTSKLDVWKRLADAVSDQVSSAPRPT